MILEQHQIQQYIEEEEKAQAHEKENLIKTPQNLSLLEENPVTLEQAYEITGGFGKFQVISCVVSLWGLLTSGYLIYNVPYMEFEPKYICRFINVNENTNHTTNILQENSRGLDESNDQILNEWFKCTSNDFCTSNETLEWKIDWTNEESLHNWVEEFDLYCTPKYVIGLMGSSFFIASVLSSLIFPRLADLFGRKKIFLVGFYMNTITLIIFLFQTNIYAIFIVLAIEGIADGAKDHVGYIYGVEFLPIKQQITAVTLALFMDGMTLIITSFLFAFITKQWQPFQIYNVTLSIILIFVIQFFLPESPRFLHAHRRYRETRQVFSKIGTINKKVKRFNFKFTEEVIHQELFPDQKSAQQDIKKKLSIFSICEDKHLVTNLFIMILCWSTCTFNYFLISFYIKYIPGNIFVNTVISALADALAAPLAGLIFSKFQAKLSLFISLSLAGLSILGLIITQEELTQEQAKISLYVPLFILLSMFSITTAYNVSYFANMRLFPTRFLTTSLGICNFCGRTVAIFSPIIAEIEGKLPLITFLCSCIVTAFLTLLLKPGSQHE